MLTGSATKLSIWMFSIECRRIEKNGTNNDSCRRFLQKLHQCHHKTLRFFVLAKFSKNVSTPITYFLHRKSSFSIVQQKFIVGYWVHRINFINFLSNMKYAANPLLAYVRMWCTITFIRTPFFTLAYKSNLITLMRIMRFESHSRNKHLLGIINEKFIRPLNIKYETVWVKKNILPWQCSASYFVYLEEINILR